MQGNHTLVRILVSAVSAASLSVIVSAQAASPAKPAIKEPPAHADNANAAGGVAAPPGYVIGADDLLSVRFWADTQLSADVVVRPDGKISVPLLNDVQAAGLTPEQLNTALEKAASK